jgi:predicted nucleotidyltransferase
VAPDIQGFLSEIIHWAEARPDMRALTLVGSHARGTATSESDVDLVLITSQPEAYLEDTGWASAFGKIERQQIEDWGKVTSLRVWYADGREVEFGLTGPAWAAQPLDEGTRRVIADGVKILYDPGGLFRSIQTK